MMDELLYQEIKALRESNVELIQKIDRLTFQYQKSEENLKCLCEDFENIKLKIEDMEDVYEKSMFAAKGLAALAVAVGGAVTWFLDLPLKIFEK